MKIIRQNIIPFSGFKAINLFGVLFARKKARLSNVDINHETIHSKQIVEVMLASLLITIPIAIFWLWWIGLTLTVCSYYIWYIVEFLFKLFRKGASMNSAYKNISFEREAYQNEKDLTYLDNRKLFSFIKYIK